MLVIILTVNDKIGVLYLSCDVGLEIRRERRRPELVPKNAGPEMAGALHC
jgi:hypothetical protein